jgi:hypothetical protein
MNGRADQAISERTSIMDLLATLHRKLSSISGRDLLSQELKRATNWGIKCSTI